MKKQFLLLAAFLSLGVSSFSQHIYRTTEYVGSIPQTDEFAIDICQDGNGNMYAIGQSDNGSNADISVSKFDALGNLQWEQTYNNGGEDIPLHVSIGESGNVYVTGNSEVSGINKGLVLKYDATGALQWDMHAGGVSGATILNSATRGLDGATVLVGSYMSSATEQKAVVYKINSDGTQAWSDSYDYSTSGSEDDEFTAISINSYNGDIYLGGMANGNKILIAKYNASGTQQWLDTPRYGKVLDMTSGGNSTYYYMYFVAQTSVSFPDAYTAKYNSNGTLQWEDSYTDGALNGAAEIHYYNSKIYAAFRHNGGSSNPNRDDYIIKYSTAGAEEWVLDYDYIGSTSVGHFGVNNNAKLLSFNGNFLYCINNDLTMSVYHIDVPTTTNYVYSPDPMPEYQNLRELPNDVMPVKALVNNNITFILGDGKYEAVDNSRIALASYCHPQTNTLIDTPTDACGTSLTLNATNAENPHWEASATSGGTLNSFTNEYTVNPIADVDFTNEMVLNVKLRGEDQYTCPTYDSKDITFHKNPIPVISGDLEYCEGQTTTLDAGAFETYTWSTTEETQTINATAGAYTVEVTDANGCTGTSQEVTVTENALPNVNLGEDQTTCNGETVTLDAGVFDSYAWSTTETTQTIDVTTTGDYILEVTDVNFCSNSDTIHVQFDDCTGINTVENNNLTVYPNPAHNHLQFVMSNGQLVESVQILDITGKTVKTIISGKAKQSIDISTLQNGIYFVKIGTQIQKFIKE